VRRPPPCTPALLELRTRRGTSQKNHSCHARVPRHTCRRALQFHRTDLERAELRQLLERTRCSPSPAWRLRQERRWPWPSHRERLAPSPTVSAGRIWPLRQWATVSQAVAHALACGRSQGARSSTRSAPAWQRRPPTAAGQREHLLGACAELADSVLRACLGCASCHQPGAAGPDRGVGLAGPPALAATLGSRPGAGRHSRTRPTRPGRSGASSSSNRVRECPGLRAHRPASAGGGAGLPAAGRHALALELAAARAACSRGAVGDPALNDRFRLLTGGSRWRSPISRPCAASMDWSYELLARGGARVLLGRWRSFRR